MILINYGSNFSNFYNIRSLQTNKETNFGDILRNLKSNSEYCKEYDQILDKNGKPVIDVNISKMFEDGLFEQYRKN